MTAVLVIVVFRNQIRDALRRARSIDAMGINMKLAEETREVQEALAETRFEAEEVSSDEATSEIIADGDTRKRLEPFTVDAARKAMGSVVSLKAAMAELPLTSPRRATRSKHGLDMVLAAVAVAFGYDIFSRQVAAAIAARTGQLGWLDLYETQEKVKEMIEDKSLPVNNRETRRILVSDGIETVESLLEQILGVQR
ncbi:hypothetical protein GCM10027176_36310 [Actinoallomurus bryophytorum]